MSTVPAPEDSTPQASASELRPTGVPSPVSSPWPGWMPIVGFFVLALALSWVVGAILKGVPLVAPDGLFLGGVALAAIIVLAVTEGRAGLADLGSRLVRWRVGARWYAIVLAVPVGLVSVVTALVAVLGSGGLEWSRRPELATVAVMLVVLLLLPLGAPLAEEIGWRGYALPRMLARASPLTASLVIGVFWALWHVPVVLSDPVLRTPVPFLLQVVPLSLVFGWLFLRTRGSVLIAVLFHAWFDVVLFYAAAVINPGDYQLMWWLLLGAQVIVAGAVVVAGGLRSAGQQERT